MVSLAMFGTFHATYDGRPVEIPVSTARALLAYLALEADRPHSRTHLAALLWPDHSPEAAHTNLRQALARIRRGFPAPVSASIVTATSQMLQFGLAPDVVDAVRFQHLLADDRAADPHSAMGFACRQEAIDLYRGNLLEGVFSHESQPFDDWLQIWRQQLLRSMLEALRVQSLHYRQEGEFNLMLQTAIRQVDLEPWRESGHRDVMLAHTLRGDRGAAIAQFQRCAHILRHELGVGPDPEMMALFEQIRHGQVIAAADDSGSADTRSPGGGQSLPRAMTDLDSGLATTSFVGRGQELDGILATLFEQDVRLVTITGPGGVGKTRLAVSVGEAARNLAPDGVWFVSLAAVSNPDHVPYALADVLDIQVTSRVPLLDRLAAALSNQRALIVLDNFEQVIDAAPIVSQMLQAAPALRILVTSRERLHLGGEHVVRLSPLDVPAVDESSYGAIVGTGAVQLLVERGRLTNPDFAVSPANSATIAAICRRLEGLPLAIELAAARLAILEPDALLERLDHQLAVLTSGPRDAPVRQQTMQATLAWSYDLLTPEQQQVFRWLAVFPGGFTIETVEALGRALGAVGGPGAEVDVVSSIASLVSKSLVIPASASGNQRFRLLEVVHEYAAGQLDAMGESRACWAAHAGVLVERFGADHELTPFAPDDLAWDAALEAEFANLQHAFDHLLAFGDMARFAELAALVGWHWFVHGRLPAARDRLLVALPHRHHLPRALGVSMAITLGITRLSLGEIVDAYALLTGELREAEEAGDHLSAAQARVPIGVGAAMRGDYETSLACHQAALAAAARIEDTRLRVSIESVIRATMGSIALEAGNPVLARECHLMAIDGYRQVGGVRGEMLALTNLGNAVRDAEGPAAALAWYRQGLALAATHGDKRALVASLRVIASVMTEMGTSLADAATLLGAEDQIQRRYGVRASLPRAHLPGDQEEQDLRGALGDEAYLAAWQAGQQLSLDDAIALAKHLAAVPAS